MVNLTPEQTTLLNLLAPGDYAWADLNTDQQQLLSTTLRPTGTFTDEQRELLADWYLVITPQQLATANAVLAPLGLGVGSRQTSDGRMVVNAHLLTDCLWQGDNYYLISHILNKLKLVKLEIDKFPEEELLND